MKLKPNYFLIPLTTIVVAVLGSLLTDAGMQWYNTELIKPELTPPAIAFPIAWTTIFTLTTISALIFWNKSDKKAPLTTWIALLFLLNAVLNVLWTFLFFYSQAVTEALIEMLLLEATVLALIFLIWKISKTASLLLLPYFIWVGFATYLTYQIIGV